ncbi:MAG: T9SS type A sorting domain-containing protein [Candidatus Fermentibacteraceae bacterium]|nr:T9SS type A sorting domain-containing protein [Candidatus Fermentibacteraceae bacterium]MBN2607870.1 T9SS type A sorting domain-containing protein [Candidatus Fermentibacteraceae bacterium]
MDSYTLNETVERYSYTGSIQSGPYLFQPIGLPVFYDIGYNNGEIWFACDDSDSPIKAFNTAGALTGYVMDTVVPAANGLCFEDSRFLWASDIHADRLYRIDLNPTGIAGGGVLAGHSLSCSMNPFYSIVTVSGEGYAPDAVLEVFDLSGRMVLSAPFNGTFTWSGCSEAGDQVSPGAYIVVVRDGLHRENLSLVRL